MKSFSQQFTECSKGNMTETGPVQKFKDFPDLLPHPFSKAARPIAKQLAQNPDLGLNVILCKRFGGQCHSNHARCLAFRLLAEFDKNNPHDAEVAFNVLTRIANGKDEDIVTYGTCTRTERGVDDSSNRSPSNSHRV